MVIGVDFDNTIVCYDDLFHNAAVERGLISAQVPKTKESVRDALRHMGCEERWTELQGYVYGAHMRDVPAYAGAIEIISRAVAKGVAIIVISHKTRYPFRGPKYDLHRAAFGWLESHGFFNPGAVGLRRDAVIFTDSKREKMNRIAETGCSHFIDDLPEFLADPSFPEMVQRILFAPQAARSVPSGLPAQVITVRSWQEISECLGI